MYRYAANNPVKYTDPTGLYTKEEIKTFKKSSPEEQMAFLKKEVEKAKAEGASAMGTKAAEIRHDLRSKMKLGGLFKNDFDFMNNELRNFLNLKEDGTMNYSITELTKKNGWREVCSVGSQYHQTTAGKNLNAKFVNKDGREIVIKSTGDVIFDYPDKGTFNYVNGNIFSSILWGGHNLYDIKPYNSAMATMNLTIAKRYHGFFKGGAWYGNSHYWKK